MDGYLHLTIADFKDPTHWRWILNDAKGKFLADHEVAVNPDGPDSLEFRGFTDLPAYLDFYSTPGKPAEHLLSDIGQWAGDKIFGGLAKALRKHKQSPVTVVRVTVPPQAQELLSYPFDLAHLDGKPLAQHGVRFIFQRADAAEPKAIEPVSGSLRILALFSLPDPANPLNLRRERHEIARLVEQIVQTHGVAVELRILQYGATRKTLREALEEAPGWDIIHLSGHGLAGEFLLENERGENDLISADELAELLSLTRQRLKLLTLSACYSGALTHEEARSLIGLEARPTATKKQAKPTELPSLAQRLSEELDCAALAMRYSVGDEFAANLVHALFRMMLEKGHALPGALQLAVGRALEAERGDGAPPLSLVTPMLFGQRAADLLLKPPRLTPQVELRRSTLAACFPPEPERFVGRLMPMLRANRAFAPESPHRGVLFYGMAGAGKTACALELAFRHGDRRFTGYVWHKAPNEGDDITSALGNFLLDMENQLGIQDAALIAHAGEPQVFKGRTLPRLKAMLSNYAILIVLDNIESLLTSDSEWREPLWGSLIATLLGHNGLSRLVLTSRRLPASLESHAALLRESIHALSFSESVVLARELPNLRNLFHTSEGIALLTRILRAIQGHPKLLELADGIAADPARLQRLVDQTESDTEDRRDLLGKFFATGETEQQAENFIETLRNWTTGIAATLPPTARLLFQFLSRLEDADRQIGIITANWKDFLNRIKDFSGDAAAALKEPDLGLAKSFHLLTSTGLIEGRGIPAGRSEGREQGSAEAGEEAGTAVFRIHPAVAEAGRDEADPATLEAADMELGDFHIAQARYGAEKEMEGAGQVIVESGRRAAPYLLRTRRWKEAFTLLEEMIRRDTTPATLEMAIPLLRQIAEAIKGTTDESKSGGVLAMALILAGRYPEAGQLLRAGVERCEAQGDFRLASGIAGHLLNLLRETGCLQEALALVERIVEFTRRAGLGPWTQLADECRRLQILSAMGRYEEVLAEVEKLRGKLKTLPEKSEAKEAVDVWNVREGLLHAGLTAAMGLEKWQTALDLNKEFVQFKQQRGADENVIAQTRFNAYGPLLRLGRYGEARKLLEYCRAVYEKAHDIAQLGAVFTALADLEDKEGHRDAAVRFEKTALHYKYKAGQPDDCAISHNNLANYLERTGAAPEEVLAHRLAGALLSFQSGSGGLALTLRNLALSDLPDAPPTFDRVVAIVERIEGVRFREMFLRLPRRAPDGDAAIAEIWKMVKAEQQKLSKSI
jgi:tetratricopeptide (TPR) repeat protein